MTDSEIRMDILRVCKVAGWDSDFNVVGFHFLCDKLKELGAVAEREACAKVCEDGVANAADWDSSYWDQACENRAAAIRARGQE